MKKEVILLVAGQNNRMGRSFPKTLYPIGGVPILQRILDTLRMLNPYRIHLVHRAAQRPLFESTLSWADHPIHWVTQNETKGTAHAVQQALPHLDPNSQVLILCGDVPLLQAHTLKSMCKGQADVVLLTAEHPCPGALGRVIRDANQRITKIKEASDAQIEERRIKEVFSGALCTHTACLKQYLPMIVNHNAQKEYYLTDLVDNVAQQGTHTLASVQATSLEEIQGINTLHELAILERFYQRMQAEDLLKEGVWIIDPHRFDLRGQLTVGQDVKIEPNVLLEGNVKLGDHVVIEANVTLRNVTIEAGAHIKAHCVIEDAYIGEQCRVGPFAHIRLGSYIERGGRIGNFVELKETTVGRDSKIPHLSYMGDASVGAGVNIGAGSITCNFDGQTKHKTTIADQAFIGSHVTLIAPLTIGECSTIGAGSVISKDTPPFHLSLSRGKQRMVKRWKKHPSQQESQQAHQVEPASDG